MSYHLIKVPWLWVTFSSFFSVGIFWENTKLTLTLQQLGNTILSFSLCLCVCVSLFLFFVSLSLCMFLCLSFCLSLSLYHYLSLFEWREKMIVCFFLLQNMILQNATTQFLSFYCNHKLKKKLTCFFFFITQNTNKKIRGLRH